MKDISTTLTIAPPASYLEASLATLLLNTKPSFLPHHESCLFGIGDYGIRARRNLQNQPSFISSSVSKIVSAVAKAFVAVGCTT